jgi:hypothetical protein
MRNHLLPLEAAKKVDDEARTFALGLIDEWLPHPRRNGDVRVGSNLAVPGVQREGPVLLKAVIQQDRT